jgi:hypothetical protein
MEHIKRTMIVILFIFIFFISACTTTKINSIVQIPQETNQPLPNIATFTLYEQGIVDPEVERALLSHIKQHMLAKGKTYNTHSPDAALIVNFQTRRKTGRKKTKAVYSFSRSERGAHCADKWGDNLIDKRYKGDTPLPAHLTDSSKNYLHHLQIAILSTPLQDSIDNSILWKGNIYWASAKNDITQHAPHLISQLLHKLKTNPPKTNP